MLTLVREMAQDLGTEVAWHTGSVPQDRRRAEIARFKRDPECRLFLSTDSGSVGLNLQTASAVINLDLPWNPAKLEQRIARAWRKNQMRTVDVINLVTEDSIEHAMLHVLSQKQALADGVLDGEGDLKAMALPSGRRAFVERMAAMMTPPAAPEPEPAPEPSARDGLPERTVGDELIEQHGDALLLLESRRAADGSEVLLAVLEDEDAAAAERQRRAAGEGPRIEVLDRRSYDTIQRLTGIGALQTAPAPSQELHRSPRLAAAAAEPDRQRLAKGAEFLGNAERKLRMALLLAEGGFAAEAMPALDACLQLAADARRLMTGEDVVGEAAIAEPSAAAARPLDEVAGSIANLLADIGRSLHAAV